MKAGRLAVLGTVPVAALALAGCNAEQEAAVTQPARTVVRTVTSTSVLPAPRTSKVTPSTSTSHTSTHPSRAATHSADETRSTATHRATPARSTTASTPQSTATTRSTVVAAPATARTSPPARHTSAYAPAPHTTTTTTMSGSCSIKGNISDEGEKIYHVPGQRYYNITKISPAKGERWFCSEAQAVAAGWRPAKV